MEEIVQKKRMLSGIQPSGDLHLGNYLGAINFPRHCEPVRRLVWQSPWEWNHTRKEAKSWKKSYRRRECYPASSPPAI